MKIEIQEHYGSNVKTNVAMDILRRDQCLCLNCMILFHCEDSEILLNLCKNKNLALMVTRCPNFIDKHEFKTGLK